MTLRMSESAAASPPLMLRLSEWPKMRSSIDMVNLWDLG